MNTRINATLLGVVLATLASGVLAGPKGKEQLIELDKAWGTASLAGDTDTAAGLLSDDLMGVDGSGIGGKAEQLAANEDVPEGATYQPTDYSVMFLDKHTAVMTHATKGDNAHYSLHVWSDKGGSWQVVATSSTPAASE